MATVVNRILWEDPNKDKFKELKEKYKRPANVDNMQVPTIDNTLWRVLDRQTRAVDLQLQRDMGSLTTCMIPVLHILDSLQNPTGNQKEDIKKKALREIYLNSCHILSLPISSKGRKNQEGKTSEATSKGNTEGNNIIFHTAIWRQTKRRNESSKRESNQFDN